MMKPESNLDPLHSLLTVSFNGALRMRNTGFVVFIQVRMLLSVSLWRGQLRYAVACHCSSFDSDVCFVHVCMTVGLDFVPMTEQTHPSCVFSNIEKINFSSLKEGNSQTEKVEC